MRAILNFQGFDDGKENFYAANGTSIIYKHQFVIKIKFDTTLNDVLLKLRKKVETEDFATFSPFQFNTPVKLRLINDVISGIDIEYDANIANGNANTPVRELYDGKLFEKSKTVALYTLYFITDSRIDVRFQDTIPTLV